MNGKGKRLARVCVFVLVCAASVSVSAAQTRRVHRGAQGEEQFGPVVRAYLGYLRAQQEVVDDRISRHEISSSYYRRNSNRIHALKQMALRIARETRNDYLPELEAIALDEFDTLFFEPLPKAESLRVGETLNYTFRFLGTVAAGREKFYLFARLDPYEQAELRKKDEAGQTAPAAQSSLPAPSQTAPVQPSPAQTSTGQAQTPAGQTQPPAQTTPVSQTSRPRRVVSP